MCPVGLDRQSRPSIIDRWLCFDGFVFAGTGQNLFMLTIGDLAKSAGVGVSTVRHYERQKLVSPSGRSAGNYRLYNNDDLQELRFIVQAKRLGFTLAEIRELLFLDEKHDACADLNERIREKRTAIAERIRDLQQMDQALGMLLDRCPGNPDPGSLKVCPMWASLHETDASEGPGEG